MGRIIDATLSVLDNYNLSDEDIYEFIDLIHKLGIDNIQVSMKTLARIAEQLRSDITYYVESDKERLTIDGSLPDNVRYFSHYNSAPDQSNIQTKVFSKRVLKQASLSNDMIHLKGFDTLILDGSEDVIERLHQKISYEKLIVTPGNSYHCANAIAYLFFQKDVFGVVTTLTGISNHASTEQVVMAQQVIARSDCYDVSLFSKLAQWFELVTKEKLPPNLPVLGVEIFHVESGVHVDGILKKPSNYEPYNPSLVGLKREIILGKLSGRASIDYKLKMLLNQIRPKNDIDGILQRVKQLSVVKNGKLTDEEFVTIVREFDCHEEYQNS